MTTEPSIVTKQETHLGYEIQVATVGPINTQQDEPENLHMHHKARISIWFDGKEIRETGEAPSMRFVSREDAAEFGFEIGRVIVAHRRKLTAFKLVDRACGLFKLPRLLFRNQDFKLRQGREAGGL